MIFIINSNTLKLYVDSIHFLSDAPLVNIRIKVNALLNHYYLIFKKINPNVKF